MNKTQKGFALIEGLLIILILAIIGFGGYYVWHSQKQTDNSLTQANQVSQSKTSSNAYVSWQTYADPAKIYSVKYPGDWETYNNGEHPTVATDVIAVGPKDNNTIITISSYASAKTPKNFLTADSLASPLNSQDLTINGNGAYYQETGDNTYTSLAYAVGHNSTIVTVSMTEKLNNPPTDNTQYVSQFHLIAKSLKFE